MNYLMELEVIHNKMKNQYPVCHFEMACSAELVFSPWIIGKFKTSISMISSDKTDWYQASIFKSVISTLNSDDTPFLGFTNL